MRHRPIGIGVQGLADAFMRLRFTFESEDARVRGYHDSYQSSRSPGYARGRHAILTSSPRTLWYVYHYSLFIQQFSTTRY